MKTKTNITPLFRYA